LQKKNLLSAFTPTHIRTLTPVFWENAKKMVLGIDESIQRSLTGRRLVPLHDWGTRATLDIIGVAGMGYDFGTLNNPNNDLSAQYRKMFLEPSTAFNWLELLGNYVDFRLLLKMPIKKNRELTQGSQYIRRVAQQVIRGKTKLLESNGDLHEETDIISVALASGGFSEEQLVDHVMTFLVAGHESTATAFEWATYEIARRPEMQNRLRREIRTHIPSLKECIDIGSSIESMPYLNAVCSEVLRFYPFVPFATRVASKDNTILGTFVPKGTIVSFAAYATNHDKSLWGPDADQFDPERWMGHKQARSGGSKSNYALLTFSAGAKSCIGQGWTRAELACLVAATVGRFNIELANPKENQLKIGKTMKLKAGVNAYMEVVDGWD
jgi:cytochrome P450